MPYDFSKIRRLPASVQRAQATRCRPPCQLAPQKSAPPQQPPVEQPHATPEYSYSTDLLGCVYSLVQAHARGPGLPQLTDGQIFRAWNDATLAPPEAEFCVLTHLSSVRHGTNVHDFEVPEGDTDMGQQHMYNCIEHAVQVDFFSTLQNGQNAARRRASILEIVFNSINADSIIQALNPVFCAMFAEDTMAMNELDETHGNRQRHSVTLHISETFHHAIPQRFFDTVKLRTKPVDSIKTRED